MSRLGLSRLFKTAQLRDSMCLPRSSCSLSRDIITVDFRVRRFMRLETSATGAKALVA